MASKKNRHAQGNNESNERKKSDTIAGCESINTKHFANLRPAVVCGPEITCAGSRPSLAVFCLSPCPSEMVRVPARSVADNSQ